MARAWELAIAHLKRIRRKLIRKSSIESNKCRLMGRTPSWAMIMPVEVDLDSFRSKWLAKLVRSLRKERNGRQAVPSIRSKATQLSSPRSKSFLPSSLPPLTTSADPNSSSPTRSPRPRPPSHPGTSPLLDSKFANPGRTSTKALAATPICAIRAQELSLSAQARVKRPKSNSCTISCRRSHQNLTRCCTGLDR